MKLLLIIGIGGFIGSISRYLMNTFVQNWLGTTFPIGTLFINILGCFIIGVVFAVNSRTAMTNEAFLFFTVGLCGGFTTFSAFTIETIGLLRTGQVFNSFIYILSSVIAGIASTFAGFSLFRNF